jgi:hypothetical protein
MYIRYTATGLLLMAVLTSASFPTPARANDHSLPEESPIRLYASARIAPIGAISVNSLSGPAVAINGRPAQTEAPIWSGELIRVAAGRTVKVILNSIGQVTLARGAVARFAIARASSDGAAYDVLVASIAAGSADVRLNPGVGAYVETGISALTSSRGAIFSVNVEEGRAFISTVTGAVRLQDQPPPQDVNIRVVDDLGRPVSSGSQFSVRARSTRQVQVQVTDKNDKPLPDLPVLFSLGDPCLGSLGVGAVAGMTLMQKTDNRGIAAVPLVAGAARCAASITAKVEGTNASVAIKTNIVESKSGFWSTQNTLIVAAAAAAVGVGVGIGVANSGGRESITPVPPPTVKP